MWAVHSHVHFYWYAFTGIVTCVVVGYLASFCFPRANKDITGLALGTGTLTINGGTIAGGWNSRRGTSHPDHPVPAVGVPAAGTVHR